MQELSRSRPDRYRDAYGQPLLRITFDFHANDVRMTHYVTDRTVEIARLTGGEMVVPSYLSTPYSIVPYQTTTTREARSWARTRR